jgi:hypothetical protein
MKVMMVMLFDILVFLSLSLSLQQTGISPDVFGVHAANKFSK